MRFVLDLNGWMSEGFGVGGMHFKMETIPADETPLALPCAWILWRWG